jgi:hypothetical protein
MPTLPRPILTFSEFSLCVPMRKKRIPTLSDPVLTFSEFSFSVPSGPSIMLQSSRTFFSFSFHLFLFFPVLLFLSQIITYGQGFFPSVL